MKQGSITTTGVVVAFTRSRYTLYAHISQIRREGRDPHDCHDLPHHQPAHGRADGRGRGEGPYIFDKQGKQYLEGMAGLWCTALGYGNEEIIEVAERQMRELSFSHMFGGKTHASAIELADKLAAMVPMQDGRVFLGNSGSDANDTLLKLIRYHAEASGQPNRFKVIAREQGYHGVTLASAALTAIPTNHAHFQLPFEALGVLRTGSAHYYRGANEGETEADFVARRAEELEALILAEGPDTIAAMIAEPVSGAGGVIVPPRGISRRYRRYSIATVSGSGTMRSSAASGGLAPTLVRIKLACVRR